MIEKYDDLNPVPATKKYRLLRLALVWIMAFYFTSYLWLSARGQFEPWMVDPRGVTAYLWYPEGFTGDFKFERANLIRLVYRPLWFADTLFWHTSIKANTHKYPVNEPGRYEIFL